MTDPIENNQPYNPDAPTVEDLPLHEWGNEILDRLRALGHNRPGIFLAIIGDRNDVASTSNMSSENQVRLLEYLAEGIEEKMAETDGITVVGSIEELFELLHGDKPNPEELN